MPRISGGGFPVPDLESRESMDKYFCKRDKDSGDFAAQSDADRGAGRRAARIRIRKDLRADQLRIKRGRRAEMPGNERVRMRLSKAVVRERIQGFVLSARRGRERCSLDSGWNLRERGKRRHALRDRRAVRRRACGPGVVRKADAPRCFARLGRILLGARFVNPALWESKQQRSPMPHMASGRSGCWHDGFVWQVR